VTSLKFGGRRDAVRALGAAMGHLPDRDVDVVTWAPTTPSHRRARGFDQAELLARQVARTLGRRPRRLLLRPEGRSQTGHDRAERLTGPRFVTRGSAAYRVLVVDDVLTTGATLSAAAVALRRAGAVEVSGLTLASVQ
jgi:predicted amidophosphoribosyltransferase